MKAPKRSIGLIEALMFILISVSCKKSAMPESKADSASTPAIMEIAVSESNKKLIIQKDDVAEVDRRNEQGLRILYVYLTKGGVDKMRSITATNPSLVSVIIDGETIGDCRIGGEIKDNFCISGYRSKDYAKIDAHLHKNLQGKFQTYDAK